MLIAGFIWTIAGLSMAAYDHKKGREVSGAAYSALIIAQIWFTAGL